MGLNNYLYYFGGFLMILIDNGPQNPILIIKAPILGLFFPGSDIATKAQGLHPMLAWWWLRV